MNAQRGAATTDLVQSIAELLSQLGIRDDARDAVEELRRLVSTPWADYRTHPQLRSALTESGAPFEFSLKIERGQPSLRYVVDVADHRHDMVGNLDRYVEAARVTTGLPDESLRQLFGCHLEGAAPAAPGTVMHGVGLAPGGRRRSSLYFPAGWLSPAELARRLPQSIVLPNRAQVVGYDIASGAMTGWKTYHWLSVEPGTALANHPDLAQDMPFAGLVYDRFAAAVPTRLQETALFLQRTFDPAGSQQRLFFFSRPWGWASPDGMRALLALIADSLAVDIAPLRLIGATTRRHNLNLQLGLVAVGGDSRPSITFYFWPT